MPNYKGNEATLTKYKNKWRSGDTQTIRVPIALASQVLDYAHRVDEGIDNPNLPADQNIQSLTQVIEWLETVEQTPRNNFSKEKKALVRKAIDQLKSLSQVNG